METFGPSLIERVGNEALRMCGCVSCRRYTRRAIRFARAMSTWRPASWEETTGPEIRTQALFRDRWVGVVRAGHPLSKGRRSQRPATGPVGSTSACRCVGSTGAEPIDDALALLGLEREIVAVLAGGFATAIALARSSDLIASVPKRHTGKGYAQECTASSFPSPHPSSRFRCSGTRAWMPTPPIAGCGASCGTCAPRAAMRDRRGGASRPRRSVCLARSRQKCQPRPPPQRAVSPGIVGLRPRFLSDQPVGRHRRGVDFSIGVAAELRDPK